MGIRSFFSRKSAQKSDAVTFSLLAPHAKEVRLAGSFNNWNTKETVLERDSDGQWKVALPLTPGRYEYRYIVDGEWKNDQTSSKVRNPFGSYNSAIEVPASRRQ